MDILSLFRVRHPKAAITVRDTGPHISNATVSSEHRVEGDFVTNGDLTFRFPMEDAER